MTGAFYLTTLAPDFVTSSLAESVALFRRKARAGLSEHLFLKTSSRTHYRILSFYHHTPQLFLKDAPWRSRMTVLLDKEQPLILKYVVFIRHLNNMTLSAIPGKIPETKKIVFHRVCSD